MYDRCEKNKGSKLFRKCENGTDDDDVIVVAKLKTMKGEAMVQNELTTPEGVH